MIEGRLASSNERSALLRLATRLIVEEALEAEVAHALGRGYYEHGAATGAGYRNGYRTGRLKAAEGLIAYAAPQVANREAPFRSALREGFQGRTEALELTSRERVDRVPPRKQPTLWQHHAAAAPLPPPGAQQREQLGREHRIAIFAALALLDPQHHARAVHVADPERDHLGDAQPGAIGRGERGLILRPRSRLDQTCDLLGAQHERQLARLARP